MIFALAEELREKNVDVFEISEINKDSWKQDLLTK